MEAVKLNDLKNDTKLTVQLGGCGDFSCMTKADFLNSSEYLDMDISDPESIPVVTVAEIVVHVFDWESVVENFEEDSFEGFGDEFWGSISDRDRITIDSAKVIVNRALEENPTWYEGKVVDIMPEQRKASNEN
jgi:hypothetical protein